ncbi:MAG: TrkH family potassium uptake protein, partial [Rhodobacteraceae bacterium]|nr:TrkH family potassium uptake protein [Paracoccaceae bacterium]
VSGERSFVAVCHAMSIMATSGISPVEGLEGRAPGIAGEGVMMLFMLLALSRLTFSTDTKTSESGGLQHDPEFRLGLFIAIAVPLLLFARHWAGAFEFGEEDQVEQALAALWGGFFTTLSFLTTTGFTSGSWGAAQSWSGLQSPGLMLMGLALVGGGVATTAGGVKLLRVYALYRHGLRETEVLIHPSAVPNDGDLNKRVRREGTFIAWIFFMLFAVSIAALTLAFTAAGVRFDVALVLTVSGLSTTGPLIDVGISNPVRLIDLSTTAKSIFAAAMVVGRLETLAIIALISPDVWRR